MTIEEKINSMHGPQSHEEKLYQVLLNASFFKDPYHAEDLCEDMTLIKQNIWGWWKPRFLLNHSARSAYEFMDIDQTLLTVTDEDIDWNSLHGLPEKVLSRAKEHNAHFPTVFRGGFHNGVADVEWQLNPDGQYYADEDGFGMTDDEEISLRGKIDRTGKVVEKFTYNK